MITYLTKDGSYIYEYSENDDWRCVAKTARVDDDKGNIKLEKFYVKLSGGTLIDARVKSTYELKKLHSTKYKEVSRQIFDLYVKYLKSETHVTLRSIERLLEDNN